LVYLDETGELLLRLDASGAEQALYHEWRERGCDHHGGQLIYCRIGNIGLVSFLRDTLEKSSGLFPILLGKVLYNGTHGGDFLNLDQVLAVQGEIELLAQLHRMDQDEESMIRRFETQVRELVGAALSVGKPIVF